MSLRERAFFRYFASTKWPILVGPWRSEVGFEVLYWLPWLQRFCRQYQIKESRLIAISRGGAAQWYSAAKAVELYDYLPPDRIRKAMIADAGRTGSVKQFAPASWEEKLIPLIADDLGLRRYHVLHPSVMYRGLNDFWAGKVSMEVALKDFAFDPFPIPHPPLDLPLPERFVAVRFYQRHTWPMDEPNQLWVGNLVDRIAKKLPVVVLDPPFHADDHQDFPLSGPNIISLAPYVTLRNNLAVQSAVIAKSQAFVGTYGGTMQLAVRLRKPAVGFYKQFSGTAAQHLDLTHRLGVMQNVPAFVGRPEDAQFVMEVMLP
jgi:hypothetical protein